MNTTLIFAELLVIGAEGLVWAVLLVLTLFGVEPIDDILKFFEGWETGFYFILLALVYVFGVVLDRFADSRFKGAEEKIRKDTVGHLSENFVVIRYSLGKQNEFLNQQLEYTRTRMRIARASAINFPVIAVLASAYVYFRVPGIETTLRGMYIAFILLTGVLSLYVGNRAWRSLQIAHLNLAKKMYIYENGTQKPKKPKKKINF